MFEMLMDKFNFKKICKNCKRGLGQKSVFSCMECGYFDWRKALINGIIFGICCSVMFFLLNIIISFLFPNFLSFLIGKTLIYVYLFCILFLPFLFILYYVPHKLTYYAFNIFFDLENYITLTIAVGISWFLGTFIFPPFWFSLVWWALSDDYTPTYISYFFDQSIF